jgi:hypothetical protein
MIDITQFQQGVLDEVAAATWRDLVWIGNGDWSAAIRQKVSDKQWYVTRGYAPDERVVFGPFRSKEEIEMRMVMGEIDEIS